MDGTGADNRQQKGNGKYMKTVNIREIRIGTGIPKICVPVTGTTEQEILEQTKQAVEKQPDLLEWRADFYCHVEEREKVAELAGKMRTILRQIPMIFTVRTAQEGGNCRISTKDYVNILKAAAESPEIDLVDVELYKDFSQMEKLTAELQKKGKKVIASNHHFQETPAQEKMENILDQMEAAGADIRKLAVMPQDSEDVLKLLAATVWANKNGEAPVITMSMGSLGAVSRVCGQVFGSAVTFGTVGAASAPGQLELEELRSILERLQP